MISALGGALATLGAPAFAPVLVAFAAGSLLAWMRAPADAAPPPPPNLKEIVSVVENVVDTALDKNEAEIAATYFVQAADWLIKQGKRYSIADPNNVIKMSATDLGDFKRILDRYWD